MACRWNLYFFIYYLIGQPAISESLQIAFGNNTILRVQFIDMGVKVTHVRMQISS